MRESFKFNLKGEQLLVVWLLIMAFVLAPYVYFVVDLKDYLVPSGLMIFRFYGALALLTVIAYALIFHMIKLCIEGIEYKGQSLVFGGAFGQFIGKFLLGFFLSIITLGIYSPWFIAKMQRFFVDNTSHDADQMKFEGKGSDLFVILLLTFFLPVVVLVAIAVVLQIANGGQPRDADGIIYELVTLIVMIPYMYYVYKWMVNVKFRSYSITWHTDFWNSCGKILLEMLLTMITLGIYYPLAFLRLYKYFAERTVAVSETQKKKFGYDIESGADFLFMWGQILLTIITLGIYTPWATVKMYKRILGKTYSEAIVE